MATANRFLTQKLLRGLKRQGNTRLQKCCNLEVQGCRFSSGLKFLPYEAPPSWEFPCHGRDSWQYTNTAMTDWYSFTFIVYASCILIPLSKLCPAICRIPPTFAQVFLTLCTDSSQTKLANSISQMPILLGWDTIASEVSCSTTPLNSTHNYVGLRIASEQYQLLNKEVYQ